MHRDWWDYPRLISLPPFFRITLSHTLSPAYFRRYSHYFCLTAWSYPLSVWAWRGTIGRVSTLTSSSSSSTTSSSPSLSIFLPFGFSPFYLLLSFSFFPFITVSSLFSRPFFSSPLFRFIYTPSSSSSSQSFHALFSHFIPLIRYTLISSRFPFDTNRRLERRASCIPSHSFLHSLIHCLEQASDPHPPSVISFRGITTVLFIRSFYDSKRLMRS